MMSSSRVGENTSLSQRFLTLKSFNANAVTIWDIGCDHGHLGASFESDSDVMNIHLVDPSLPVFNLLKKNYIDAYITRKAFFIHHKEGQDIILGPEKKTIYIAGMGGKEIREILDRLTPQLSVNDRVVVSPHRKILELRSYLADSDLRMFKEELVFENSQYYQILGLSRSDQYQKVTLFGKDLWKGSLGEQYRKHQILHFTPHNNGQSRAYVTYLKSLGY